MKQMVINPNSEQYKKLLDRLYKAADTGKAGDWLDKYSVFTARSIKQKGEWVRTRFGLKRAVILQATRDVESCYVATQEIDVCFADVVDPDASGDPYNDAWLFFHNGIPHYPKFGDMKSTMQLYNRRVKALKAQEMKPEPTQKDMVEELKRQDKTMQGDLPKNKSYCTRWLMLGRKVSRKDASAAAAQYLKSAK